MAVEGKEITALSSSELATIKAALEIIGYSDSLADGKFLKWNGTSEQIESSNEAVATINDAVTSENSAWSGSKVNTSINALINDDSSSESKTYSSSTIESKINSKISDTGTSESSAWSSSKTRSDVRGYGKRFGNCSSDADSQAKTVTGVSFVETGDVVEGFEINVFFSNGSSYGDSWGQCTGLTGETGNATTNELTRAQAPTLSVCGSTAYPITVAGQYAGEGFIGANEVHTFVLVERADGYAWEDLTAKNIYCNKNRNYKKQRDGLIEQWGVKTNSIGNGSIEFIIKHSNSPNVIATIKRPNEQTSFSSAMSCFIFSKENLFTYIVAWGNGGGIATEPFYWKSTGY